jgi:hypothetical protein
LSHSFNVLENRLLAKPSFLGLFWRNRIVNGFPLIQAPIIVSLGQFLRGAADGRARSASETEKAENRA